MGGLQKEIKLDTQGLNTCLGRLLALYLDGVMVIHEVFISGGHLTLVFSLEGST